MPILLQAKDRDGMPSHIEVLSQTKLSMRGGDLVHAIPVWRELAPGYAAPAEFTYTEDVNAGQPAALLHMRVDDNRLVCEGVTIRPPRGRSLRGSDLRAVRVGEMLERVPKAATQLVSFDPFDEHGSHRDEAVKVRVLQRMVVGDDGTIRRGADDEAWLVTAPVYGPDEEPLWPEKLENMSDEEIVAELRRRRAKRQHVLVDHGRAPRGGPVDPREVQVAADAYRRAKLSGDRKPMVAVMNALGLDAGQRQTAWRRVKEAERRGLL